MGLKELKLGGQEVLSGDELEALEERLSASGHAFSDREAEGVTISDIAEATGMAEREVVEQVRRIRAEAGFQEPLANRPSALPWIAGATLLVGVGLTWWRLRPPPAWTPTANDLFSPSRVSSQTTRSTTTRSLVIDMTRKSPVRPPAGFKVETIGQVSDFADEEYSETIHALPYETVRDRLVQSAEPLVTALAEAEGSAKAEEGVRYHGMDGGIFSPRPGFVRLSMSGWAGSESEWIAVPLTDAGRRQIQTLAVRVLKDAKEAQDAALRSVGEKEETINPPPGYTVRFAGRRLDFQQGPRLSFAGVPTATVARRLEEAIVNAAARDWRPHSGAWSMNAAEEAKIPRPALSRVEIMGPEGLLTEDIPTAKGSERAMRETVRKVAAKAAEQMKHMDERPLEADANGHP